MNKLSIAALAASLLALGATVAYGEQWIDYSPAKGVYMKTLVHVDPDHMDDYLTALRKTWVPQEEMNKRRGLVDTYMVQVSANPYAPGPNVVLIEHWPSMAGLDADRTRDMAMDKEFEQIVPKSAQPGLMADRAKYRTIVSQEMWTTVDYPK